MYTQLLLEDLESISPEAKFFLLKFLEEYWEYHVVSVSNKELLERFGIYDKGVKSVLTELLTKKYIALEKRLTGAKGRPKQALARGEALQALIQKWEKESVVISHEQSIAKLLAVTAERERIVWKHRCNSLDHENASEPTESRVLTNTRKLLLCVLLAKADQFGVIRDLGMTELASLVGLSKQQLRWHLKILEGSQFLLGFIPGKSIKGVEGKLKSTFVLRPVLVEGGESDKLSLLIDSETLELLGRIIRLVGALRVVYRGLEKKAFLQECMSQSDHWKAIYRIDKDVLEAVVNSVGLLLSIHDAGTLGYRRICELVCELTTAMLVNTEENNLSRPLSLAGVTEKLSQEIEKRKLGIVGLLASRASGLALLSRFVWELYKETLIVIGRSDSEGGLFQIGHCLIYPFGEGSVLVHLSLDRKGED